MRIIKALSYVLTCAALLVAGFGAGLCVKVFMARGVPVVNGGGELMLLLGSGSIRAAPAFPGGYDYDKD